LENATIRLFRGDGLRAGRAPLLSEVPRTWRSKSKLGSCFPPEVRQPHGLPLLGRLRGATALPDVSAPMQPSDSPAASTGALVPLAVGLPRDVRFSEPARRAYVDARRVGRLRCGSSAAPPYSWTSRGLPGYWGVRAHVPWSATPPREIPLAR